MKVTEARASIALNPSRLPGLDWALNPYGGCGHGCVYCFSPDVLRLSGEEPWGSFVEVRRNMPVLLAKEGKKVTGIIGLGTVTDPYQPIEEKTLLTRYCLEQLTRSDCTVCIQTKSDLVVRDIDVMCRLKDPEVGMTVTTMDPEVAMRLEPTAPEPARRVAALGKLSGAGIRTWLYLGPVIPGMNDSSDKLDGVIRAAKDAGCTRVLYDMLRLKPMIRERLKKTFGHTVSSGMFKLAMDREWEERVSIDIEVLCDDAGIKAERGL